MFRKLKDKLAEEMKSSPQRLQQFAQAAQAVVTSASSSISDISNNDLFSIADEGSEAPTKTSQALNNIPVPGFQDISLSSNSSPVTLKNEKQENGDRLMPLNVNYATNALEETGIENSPNLGIYPLPLVANRTRKLSNSSNCSDVSFRLPSYESPGGMFHLQSDLDVSASEIEDNVNVPAQLERVSKEHLYAAYRKTNEKYNKYRGRYTDLARHYRNLERENAKAKAVLVETQDKALRRISELREQCQLEQNAKAHLENALRLELDERNLKIDSLNTKIQLLQSYSTPRQDVDITSKKTDLLTCGDELNNQENSTKTEDNLSLIDSPIDQDPSTTTEQNKNSTEVQNLNNKISKLEQLLVKCKEAIKTHKEKNTQLTTEIQIVSSQLDKLNQENEKLHNKIMETDNLNKKLDDSQKLIKNLQEQVNSFESKKAVEKSELESKLNFAKKEITTLNITIDMLKKREEENVISLAENKLTIHKELEGKENEIKTLNESITKINSDLKAKDIIISNLKEIVQDFEEEKKMANEKVNEFGLLKQDSDDLITKLNEIKLQHQEIVENLRCTQLQLKQESDEKLAIIDRNKFLEARNKQISEENVSINKKFIDVEKEKNSSINEMKLTSDNVLNEFNLLKEDYDRLVVDLQNDRIRLEQYAEETDKLEREKCELSQNMQELNEKIVLVENERDNLNSVNKNITEQFQDLTNKALLLEKQLEESVSKCANYENDLSVKEKSDLTETQLKEAHENILVEYDNLKANFDELRSMFDEKSIIYDKIAKELDALSLKYKKLNDDNESLLKKTDEINEENVQLKEKFEKKSFEIEALQNQLSALQVESENKKKCSNEMITEIKQLQEELTSLLKAHNEILDEKKTIEQKILDMEQLKSDLNDKNCSNESILKAEIDSLCNKIESLEAEKVCLTKEKIILNESVAQTKQFLSENECKLKEYSDNNGVWEMKLSNILDDNNALQEKCRKVKQEKESLLGEISNMEQKLNDLETAKTRFEEAKLEKEFLNMRVVQLESDLKQTNVEKNEFMLEIDNLKMQLCKMTDDSKKHTTELQKEITKLKENESTFRGNMQLHLEEKISYETKYRSEVIEREKIEKKLENLNDIAKLNESVTEEKNILETKLLSLSNEYKVLEEKKEREVADAERKYEDNCAALIARSQDFNDLLKKHDDLNVQIKVLQQIEIEHSSLTEKVHLLEEENSKLVSSVEGLQTHLTKISMDNSHLNDKIREMLANDEIMQERRKRKTECSETDCNLNESNVKEESKTITSLQNKIMDLERQNSILIEEKLELEDQIKSSMDKHLEISDKELNSEMKSMCAKFELEKIELENRLSNVELVNRSNENNYKTLEQKNEKLSLINEKLERRLDEALVSLNHIRNLEENTELEYLRNILYEYLTGPTNNNMVLAKVLSAVVKFDHRQTQLVLEREKERQGLLGQLGLL